MRTPATRPLTVAVLAAGVLGDIALRTGIASVVGSATIVLMAAILLRSGRLRTRGAQLLAYGAVPFALGLHLRTASWLVALDSLVAIGLLLLAASYADGVSILRASVPELLARSLAVLGHAGRAGKFVGETLVVRRGAPWRSLLRGLLFAIPCVVVLGAILASGDAMFASLFHIDVHFTTGFGHVVVALSCAFVMATMLQVASAAWRPAGSVGFRPLRAIEVTVVLVALDALFGLWAIAQVVTMSGAGNHVLQTRGLTYAQYARSGFFQLLWVAGLTMAVVLALRAMIVRDDALAQSRFVRGTRVLLSIALAMVAVSVQRLGLYEDAYGLTVLRVVVHVVAIAIGVLVLLLAASCIKKLSNNNWFPAAVIVVGCCTVLALNIVNPDALVVRNNVSRAGTATVQLDGLYLISLTDDGVPSAVRALSDLSGADASALRSSLCARPHATHSWWGYNRSARAADAAIASLHCSQLNGEHP